MCYEATCSSCGKTTWGGCGRHVASVYRRVQEDRRCLCREWPGVKTDVKAGDQPSSATAASGGGGGGEGSSSCAIL